MFLRPNYRRACRCVACGKLIDDAESINNLNAVTMSIVTNQDSAKKNVYRGFKIDVVVSQCRKCQKSSRIGCLVSIALAIIVGIIGFTTHSESAGFLCFFGIGLIALANFRHREPSDADIIREMKHANFQRGTKFSRYPKVHGEMTPDAIGKLLAKLCAKYDYVLSSMDGKELISVDILREKDLITEAVLGKITDDIKKHFNIDIDVDVVLDFQPDFGC